MQKSNIFIISGPSGAGEDSIINGLKEHILFEKIITTITREMRPGEENGKSYHFVSKETFSKMIENDELFEYVEEDRNNFYGVTKKEIERVSDLDRPVIWKIDYKGVINAKRMMPGAIAILLDVPIENIEKRIRQRDDINEEYIQGRLKYAQGWYENRDKFDFFVKNQDGKLEEAIKDVAEIIKKHM